MKIKYTLLVAVCLWLCMTLFVVCWAVFKSDNPDMSNSLVESEVLIKSIDEIREIIAGVHLFDIEEESDSVPGSHNRIILKDVYDPHNYFMVLNYWEYESEEIAAREVERIRPYVNVKHHAGSSSGNDVTMVYKG